MTDEEKLMRFVMPEPNSGCWLWIGAVKKSGHGKIRINKKFILAHRLSFNLFNGIEVLDDLVVRHKCDTPCCVNPQHLESGTQKDNIHDMHRRGRENPPWGENHRSAKLKATDVLEIRKCIASGERPYLIAKRYGVRNAIIYGIKNGTKWKRLVSE